MTSYPAPACLSCKHYFDIDHPRHFDKHKGWAACEAFPNGIPERVLAVGMHDRRLPYQRSDIVYEMKEGHKIVPAIPCGECRHLEPGGRAICPAFPRGIPYEVFSTAAHDEPLPGQGNSIVFEPKEAE